MLAIEVQENFIKLVSFKNGKVYFYPKRVTFPAYFPKTTDQILSEVQSEAFRSWGFSDTKDPLLITDLSFEIEFAFAEKLGSKEVLSKIELPYVSVRDFPPQEEEVLPYLPFLEGSSDEIKNFLENQKLFGKLLPSTPYELAVAQAHAKASLAKLKGQKNWRGEKVFLIDDLFWQLPFRSQVAAVALDGLTPVGLCEIYYDDKGYFLPWAGLLQVGGIEREVFEEYLPFNLLCPSLSFNGSDTLEVESMHAGISEVRFEAGDLFLIPAEEGETLKIRKGKEAWEVKGGRLGIVVDARGRPFKLPSQTSEAKKLWKRWEQALGAHGEVERI